MISIRKTFTELDRLEDLQRVTADCYALAIRSAEEYAVEVDRNQTEQFQQDLRSLEKRLRAAASTGELEAVQSSFSDQLREYRDTANKHIKRLRKDVDAATKAMDTFASSVASNGDDHKIELKRELNRLETVARSESVDEMRAGIGIATGKIADSIENLSRSNQLVIVQLKDEIRLLHQEIRATKSTGSRTSLNSPAGISPHIEDLLLQDQSFCLLVVSVRNLKQLEQRHSPAVIDTLEKALLARFHSLVGSAAMIGRWADQAFVAILNTGPAHAMELSREVTGRLSGSYAAEESIRSENISLEVAAGIVDRRAGADTSTFFDRVAELSVKLAG